jgi:hypothetical protein
VLRPKDKLLEQAKKTIGILGDRARQHERS